MSATPPPAGSGERPTPPPGLWSQEHDRTTGQQTVPPAAESQHAPMSCPHCGAPLRSDQDWCLNCGAAVTTEIAGSRGWRIPVAIASVVLIVAAAALVFAFARLSNDADEVAAVTPTPTPTASAAPGASATPGASVTPGASTEPGATPGASVTPTVPGTTATPGATPSATPGGDSGGGLPAIPGFGGDDDGSSSSGGGGGFDSWPSGKSGYTVVLYSGDTRAQAESKARGYQGSGASVGILDSDDFSSLRGGYFVVFSGEYDSLSAAQGAAEDLQGTQPGAYARQVKP